MKLQDTGRAYIEETENWVQAGHQCAYGKWWHRQTVDKSQGEVDALVHALFGHLSKCPAVPADLRDQLAQLRGMRDGG